VLYHLRYTLFVCFYLFIVILGLNLGLALARQALYHWGHISGHLFISLPGLAGTRNAPAFISPVAGIISVFHSGNPFNITISNAQEFQFLHDLANTCYFLCL
jgi:hypothetical protein